MKAVVVFCGSASGNDQSYKDATVKLGKWLVEHKLDLVYGGGGVGLMKLLAETVLNDGGQVHGVTTKALYARGSSFTNLSDLKVVSDMDIRKKTMFEMSDGYIALPGGPGTLEEVATGFSWARLGDYAGANVLYNVNGYYDSLETLFDEMTEKGFLTKTDRQKLLFSDSLDDIYQFMDTYTPPKIRTYDKK